MIIAILLACSYVYTYVVGCKFLRVVVGIEKSLSVALIIIVYNYLLHKDFKALAQLTKGMVKS